MRFINIKKEGRVPPNYIAGGQFDNSEESSSICLICLSEGTGHAENVRITVQIVFCCEN